MFGYYIEQFKKLNLSTNDSDTTKVEGFKTSIKGFKTREEAEKALQEAEWEVMRTREFVVVESRVYSFSELINSNCNA